MENHPNWKGGRQLHSNDYITITIPSDHRFASMRDCRGTVYEHRLVMAETIGRSLTPYEQVHHLNGIKTDNRPENLEMIGADSHNLITKMQARIRDLEKQIKEFSR